VNNSTVRVRGSSCQTICTPARKYSWRLRAISPDVFPTLNASTAKSGTKSGRGSVGTWRLGKRSHEIKAAAGPTGSAAPDGPGAVPYAGGPWIAGALGVRCRKVATLHQAPSGSGAPLAVVTRARGRPPRAGRGMVPVARGGRWREGGQVARHRVGARG
jgi:hypothetical protein